jgi:uncharacterized RDD family membrane protein YckC
VQETYPDKTHANLSTRIFASLLDSFILIFMVFVVILLIWTSVNVAAIFREHPRAVDVPFLPYAIPLICFIAPTYFVLTWKLINASFGQFIFDIHLLNDDYSKKISTWKLILRMIIYLIIKMSGILLIVNLILIKFTVKKQTLQDIVVGTIVVND